MQFGVQFFPAIDHTDKSAAEYYAESLAIAEEAETLGFRHDSASHARPSRRSGMVPQCRPDVRDQYL